MTTPTDADVSQQAQMYAATLDSKILGDAAEGLRKAEDSVEATRDRYNDVRGRLKKAQGLRDDRREELKQTILTETEGSPGRYNVAGIYSVTIRSRGPEVIIEEFDAASEDPDSEE